MSNENNTYHTQHLACVQLHPLVVQLHCCSWVVLVVTVVFLTFEIHLCFYLWISMTFTCFYRAFHHCGKKELGICQFFFFFNFFFLLPVKELFLFQVTIVIIVHHFTKARGNFMMLNKSISFCSFLLVIALLHKNLALPPIHNFKWTT